MKSPQVWEIICLMCEDNIFIECDDCAFSYHDRLRLQMLRILHLSDIHFGQEKHGERFYHDDIRDQLVADLNGLLPSNKSLDLILLNGDIAFSGKKVEYSRAVEWLDQLLGVGRCDETAILTIPGNHDVDLGLISLGARQAYAQLRNSSPETARSILHDYAVEREEVNAIFPKLGTYLEFARGYNSEFQTRDVPSWIRYRDLGDGCRLRIIGLCSVQVSDLDDRQGIMLLGDKQYIFPEDRRSVTLVMIHHPLHWLLDKIDAQSYLHSRASMILTGHEHLPDLTKMVTLSGSERIEISAGAITATKSDRPFQFAYNLIELDFQKSPSPLLSMTVWPRIWGGNPPRFMPDTAKTGGPVSKAITIKIDLDSSADGFTARTEDVSNRGIAMPKDESADFGRLKHYFWHYLTWNQRITVLVRAAALPESAESRLPQTIELEALQRAKEDGKLASVWDDIMSFVPTDKRKPNPFKREVA